MESEGQKLDVAAPDCWPSVSRKTMANSENGKGLPMQVSLDFQGIVRKIVPYMSLLAVINT